MKNHFLQLFFSLTMFLASPFIRANCDEQGDYDTIHSIMDVEQFLPKDLNKDVWILFDVDYTLTCPSTPMLHLDFLIKHKIAWKEVMKDLTEEEKLLIPVIMITSSENKLMDVSSISLISSLKKRGATVFAFTAADTSYYPDVGSFPLWREKELRNLGIDFTQDKDSILPLDPVQLTTFQPYRNTYPLFQSGILYSNVLPSKGAVLANFIDLVDRKPRHVVFIDDTKHNLHSVSEKLKQLNIPSTMLLYRQEGKEASFEFREEKWMEMWEKIFQRLKLITSDEASQASSKKNSIAEDSHA